LTLGHCPSSCFLIKRNRTTQPTELSPIDRTSPYLWTPEQIPGRIYKPNNTPSEGVKNMWSFEVFVLTPADNLGCVWFI
jgi:hypothetical protein